MNMKMQTKACKDLYSTVETSILLKSYIHPAQPTAAYLVPRLRRLNPRQFICMCVRVTPQILQMKLEVKIDRLEGTVDLTKRAS